jgi:hypothetical protein
MRSLPLPSSGNLFRMAIRIELSLSLPNSPGALNGICGLLGSESVNILAMTLETGGILRLVVDNHVRGAAVLREHSHHVVEHDVILLAVPQATGALVAPLQLVADAGVNVDYAYGGAPESGSAAIVVLGVNDAQRAASAAGV